MKNDADPFFIALGFYKPHLPFIMPQRYLDNYPEADIELADNPWVPNDLPQEAWSDYKELVKYKDVAAAGK